MQRIKIKDKQFVDLQEMTRELQEQNQVNAEALEKAGVVIKKLNDEIQKYKQDI